MLVDALGILPVALGRSKSEKFAPCAPFVRLYESDRKVRTLHTCVVHELWVHFHTSLRLSTTGV